MKEIEKDIKDIKENHLPHIYKELAQNTTDLSWLKKGYWVVASASIGALLAGVINLL